MVRKSLLTAVVLLVVGSGVAVAAPLVTPPLPGGGTYLCQAVNVGKRPIEVNLGIFSMNSGSVSSISCMGLQPGHVCSVPGDNFSKYCVVTVVKGSKRSVRGSLTALTGGAVTGVVAAE